MRYVIKTLVATVALFMMAAKKKRLLPKAMAKALRCVFPMKKHPIRLRQKFTAKKPSSAKAHSKSAVLLLLLQVMAL